MTVLLDTSVWIQHFRESSDEVVRLLNDELVVSHEYVVAELACGSLKSREDTIGYLNALATLPSVSISEAMILIETQALFSRGIGLVDVQLLASTLISPDTKLWTWDNRLHDIAAELGIAYAQPKG